MDNFKQNFTKGLKKVAKTAAKIVTAPLKKIIIIALIVALVIIGLAASYDGVAVQFSKNIGEFMKLNPIKYNIEDKSIVIEEEQIEFMEKLLEAMGTSKEDLNLSDKDLEKIYAAEMVTQEINRLNRIDGEKEELGKYYGKIFVKRAGSTSELENLRDLRYIDFEYFQNLPATEITNYYSIDGDKLCIATARITQNEDGTTTETKNIHKIDYKSSLAPYMMPAEFLLNLCFISRNPEFVMELTEKVLNNTQIVFTVLEESEEVEKKTKHTYDIETSVQYKYETYSEGALVDESLSEPEISVEEDKVDKTKTFTRQVTPIVKITYVKTWFVEQEFIYNRVTKEPVEEEIKEDDPRNLLEDEEKREHTNFELIEDNVVEGTGDKTYESRLERKINQTLYRKNTTTLITYEEGINKEPLDKADDFIELLKKPFRKPNSFSKEPAIINIVSGAEILLQMLQNNERTQAVEHIMRYVLYKYTGESYGVTELNLNMFDLNSFTSLSNTNFSTYLRQFSHSSEAPQSVDGKYYLMYGDAEENEYGWPTIGNADIQWASHHQEFATSGKVLKDGEEQTVPNVETYVNSILGNGAEEKYITSEIREMQIYIEKQVVDQVGDSIQKTSLKYVENNTQGLDLSKQQLYALTTIKYNFGNLPTTNGKSFKNVYEEGAALYEINSWEHNRYIWDNWWALLGGGEPGHIPARDAAFETYVKGIYDFSQSDAGEVFGRNYYIYYTQEQLARFSYAPSKRITRTALNEPAIFKYEENTVGTNGIIDLEGMELSTYTNSKELTFIEFKQDSGTWASMKYGETTIANEGCSITTISIVASSYGINKTPNEWTPSGNYISILNTIKQFAPNTVAVPIQGNGKSDGFAHQNVRNTDKKAIQEHLETGNPVVIHVLGNKKGYTNPYTSNQHWMALLDVSEDGKQVYVSNPNKNGGNGWVDIEYVLQALCCYYKVQQ